MAISLAQADELVRACDEAGVQLFVVKQNRLNPPIQLLKRAIDKGRFGRIYMANVTVRWQRPQEYYDAEPWRGTWEFDGGAIMNQASHYVDLIQWLVGPVESVMAKTATQARRIEAEDSGIAILKFRSGALGVIEVNVLTYPRNLEGSITILGEKRIGEDRRHGGKRDRALGLRRRTTTTTSSSSRRAPIRRTCTASGTRGTTATCSRCCGVRRSRRRTGAPGASRSS